jgi:hypothetical protein
MAASKQLELVGNSVKSLALHESPLIRDAANIAKMIEEARSKADMIAGASVNLPPYYYAPRSVSRHLDDFNQRMEIINAELIEPASPNQKVEALLENVIEILSSLHKVLVNVKAEDIQTTMPPEPATRNLDDWFDYLHAVKHRIRVKLKYIADKTGYEYSTVRKMHSLYLKEHENQKKGSNKK